MDLMSSSLVSFILAQLYFLGYSILIYIEPTMIKRKRSVSLEPTESSDVQHTQAMEEHDSFRHDHANPSSKGDSMEMDKPIAQGPISSADLVDQPTPDNVPLGIATSQTEDKSDNRTDGRR